jgi:uncharacterized protein YutE (UPF0331/DUF86 family)
MTLDADVVRSRCSEIERALDRLDIIREGGRPAFLANDDSKDIACYRLLIAIEAALALCYHVSARALREVPEDYAGCFASLEHGSLIDADLSARLQQIARFKNLLVHVYWTADYDRVFDILERHLGEFRAFSRAMAGLL